MVVAFHLGSKAAPPAAGAAPAFDERWNRGGHRVGPAPGPPSMGGVSGRTTRPLIDPFGRTVRDLRISITDRCNFRCTYCMPEEGMRWLPRDELLHFEEIERLARVFVERFAVDGIRLTGGEPTVRAHLPVLVGKLAALRLADGTKPD